ncbi:MAG TPA: FAD-binding protein, partial [Anaerolineales bacterium]
MASSNFKTFNFHPLQEAFGERLQMGVSLARYTAARVGGPADVLLEVRSADELAQAAELLWSADLPFVVIGGGSNLLVSDAGVRGVVLLNHARRVSFAGQADPPTVWAESGANFGLLARQAAQRGLGGLEWAAGIPGTLGGAVVGNAGAHGGDVAGSLRLA